MKKLLLLLVLLAPLTIQAEEIKFMVNPDWKTVLKKAKTENKLIFFDAYASWCGPCKQMDEETYKDKGVADFYNANFINVKYDMEVGEGVNLAQNLSVTAYPTLMFIDGDGNVVHRGLGFKEGAAFLTLGKKAADPNTRYAVLKSHAETLTPEQFNEFAATAEEIEDEDFTEIALGFLERQPDVLGNDALIDLLMTRITLITDQKMLEYILSNKDKIAATQHYTKEEIEVRTSAFTMGYAISSNTDEDGAPDFEGVRTVLNKYMPERALYYFNAYKIGTSLENGNQGDALAGFKELAGGLPDKISFDLFCNAVITFGPEMKDKLNDVFKLLDDYQLPAGQQKKAYLKDVAKAVVYLNMKDTANFKVYADRALASKDMPEDLREKFTEAIENLKKG